MEGSEPTMCYSIPHMRLCTSRHDHLRIGKARIIMVLTVVMILPFPLESACSCRLMKSRDSAVTLIGKILVRDVVKELDVRCYSIRQSQSFLLKKPTCCKANHGYRLRFAMA